jgi:hypothetical protein
VQHYRSLFDAAADADSKPSIYAAAADDRTHLGESRGLPVDCCAKHRAIATAPTGFSRIELSSSSWATTVMFFRRKVREPTPEEIDDLDIVIR